MGGIVPRAVGCRPKHARELFLSLLATTFTFTFVERHEDDGRGRSHQLLAYVLGARVGERVLEQLVGNERVDVAHLMQRGDNWRLKSCAGGDARAEEVEKVSHVEVALDAEVARQ